MMSDASKKDQFLFSIRWALENFEDTLAPDKDGSYTGPEHKLAKIESELMKQGCVSVSIGFSFFCFLPKKSWPNIQVAPL